MFVDVRWLAHAPADTLALRRPHEMLFGDQGVR
jgi:hypothetical protein